MLLSLLARVRAAREQASTASGRESGPSLRHTQKCGSNSDGGTFAKEREREKEDARRVVAEKSLLVSFLSLSLSLTHTHTHSHTRTPWRLRACTHARTEK